MSKLAAIRLFVAVVLLFAATLATLAARLLSPAAASAAAGTASAWSQGTLIDPLRGTRSQLVPQAELLRCCGPF
jgi:hypothetical protein